MENHHFKWDNSLFRLGHGFNSKLLVSSSLPEGTILNITPPGMVALFFGIPRRKSGPRCLAQGDVRAALEVAQEIRRLTKDLGKPSKEAETWRGMGTRNEARVIFSTANRFQILVTCFRNLPDVFLLAIS